MSSSGPDNKDSVTQVAEESFVRERPLEIERGAVLAGRYQVEEIVGKGGSGVVLRVFDRTVQNVVALKILKSELARDSKWDKRFSRELRLGRPIQHPHVCRIFDIGEADGHRFLTMELAGGGSLRDELKARPALDRPLPERLADARAAIEGLAAIHAAGVVHRDFKPDNLLRMDDGRLVISDFGLATDTATGPGVTVMIGTPHYMAPEVLAGEPATTRSDVWALGVVLHEILFGRRPERKTVSFDGGTRGPVRPATPIERNLLRLCEACLMESAGDRPLDARAVAGHFVALTDGKAMRRPLSRRVVAGVAALVGLTAVAVSHFGRHPAAPDAGSVLQPQGRSRDLADLGRVVAEIPDHVHCFSQVDARTARIVWGAPRRAEDVDLPTGLRQPSPLIPQTYEIGCPQVIDGKVLFSGRTATGLSDIRLSMAPNGSDATVMTAGAEPLWINGADQFLYTVDSVHAAVFHIPTMTFEILADPGIGAEYGIKDKAVSPAGDRIAVLYSDLVRDAIVLYEGRLFGQKRTVFPSAAMHIGFTLGGDKLLVLGASDEATTSVGELDWAGGGYRRLSSYHGFDLVSAAAGPNGTGFLAVRVTADAWQVSPGAPKQLTSDGLTYSAALSRGGDLLMSRRDDRGRLNIWYRSPNAAPVEVTDGPVDVEPCFAPDGLTWAYANYVRRSILICSIPATGCRVLHTDALVPTWPSFSPDGELLLFMTQLKTTTFTVISVDDGRIVSSWEGSDRCPPVWRPDGTVWTVEGGPGHLIWSGREPATGRRTAQSPALKKPLTNELDCRVPDAGSKALAMAPSVEIKSKETSRLLFVDWRRMLPAP